MNDYMIFKYLKPETLKVAEKLVLKEEDFEISYIKGFGKGGQKKNKTNNCVYLVYKPLGLQVKTQKYREREANLKTAVRLLIEKIDLALDPKNSKKLAGINKIREKKRRAKKKSIKKYNSES
ncbi:peptide chain release factor-like protein [bacterium]|jgi:peptide chain release factor|nr:peptide chain release factor-like protein [bacterium]